MGGRSAGQRSTRRTLAKKRAGSPSTRENPTLIETSGSDTADLRRLWTLLALGHFELDLLTLGEGRSVHGFLDVGEEILAAVARRDESITLRTVEPLDRSGF